MENKKPLWQKNDKLEPLRQPMSLQSKQNTLVIVDKSPTLQKNSDKADRLAMLEEMVAKSSLKVDAPEFVPRATENKPQISAVTSSIQNRLKIRRPELECEMIEKVEDNSQYLANEVDPRNDLKRIRQIINTLTKDPGQFDNLLQIFMETVAPYLDDLLLLSDIVKILIHEVSNLLTQFYYCLMCNYN